MMGSGCSTGKRCLAIDQINLKGVVKADSGMIAVVVNSLNKAYFLRENDPVFNGFVVKITGDSIIFKETRSGSPGQVVNPGSDQEDYDVGSLGRRRDWPGIRQKQIWLRKITGRAQRKARGESEMRKQFLTVLLPVLVVVLITASAQTQSAGTDASEARRAAEA